MSEARRAGKRRRTNYAQNSETSAIHRQVILEEVELEMGIRNRIADTIQARIKWALQLQKLLESDDCIQKDATVDVRAVAVETLRTLEAPIELLHHERVHVSESASQASVQAQDNTLPTSDNSRSGRARSSRASRLTPAAKLLFIRNAPSTTPDTSSTVAKLSCVDCGRTDFPTMQGLLNHCRLRHSRAYGSHDECIQACAVPISDESERQWIVENGTEVAAGSQISFPSLRRIFEMAVGGSNKDRLFTHDITSGSQKDPETPAKLVEVLPAESITEKPTLTQPVATHLSRTLGHHVDTPALAPFLGRAAKRRGISVYKEEEDVDIGEFIDPVLDTSLSTVVKRWRMPYHPRSKVKSEVHHNILEETPISPISVKPKLLQSLTSNPQQIERTRFHIMARIVVADRSQFIHPDSRPREHTDCTHKWMISVDSPSYTRHISTFLASMTVSSLTESGPPTLSTPLTISEPPFAIKGMASAPFLAKVMLSWTPNLRGETRPPLEVQQWVDLDPFKHASPVLGEEQLLDIELDRDIVFLPERENPIPIKWEPMGTKIARAHAKEESEEETPAHEERLRALLPRFPITLKDIKTRHPPKVDYKLAASTAHLLSLPMGRRKAIEMGRARALCDAYMKDLSSDVGLIPLVPIDVFRWLEDEGHLPRPKIVPERIAPAPLTIGSAVPTADHNFCPWCGLMLNDHNKSIKIESGTSVSLACPHRPSGEAAIRLPLLDIHSLIGPEPTYNNLSPSALIPRPLHAPVSPGCAALNAHALVAASDPTLVISIRNLILALGLPTLHDATEDQARGSLLFPLSRLGGQPDEVASCLAPHALLGLLLKPMVRQLVCNALPHVRPAPPGAVVTGPSKSRRRSKPAILTPYHILRGLRTGARESSVGTALLLAFARLGTGGAGSSVAPISHVAAGETRVKIKEA